MDTFAMIVILLFLGAAVVEAVKGSWWMFVFYMASAVINLAVVMK